MCRCASMNPGMAVMPFASIVRPLAAEGAPAAAETIFPARTTIDPRSMTPPLGPIMRALVIVRSCADKDANAATSRQAALISVYRFMVLLCYASKMLNVRNSLARNPDPSPKQNREGGRHSPLPLTLDREMP